MSEYRPLDLHDDMPFGKYKGETISELTELDYRYLCWLRDEKGIKFTDDVLETLKNKEMGL